MTPEPEVALAATEARIAWVLDHPAMSPWLKEALRAAVRSDPVASANDAEILRHLLQHRAQAWTRKTFAHLPDPEEF